MKTMFCQSCSMPIDNIEIRGTEKDGSKSENYCKYCYECGEFINPSMTINEMRTIVKTEFEKMGSPKNIIKKAIDVLPHLKRWEAKGKVVN